MSAKPERAPDVVWTIRETEDGHWQPQRQGAPPLLYASSEKAGAITAIWRWVKDVERGYVRVDVFDRNGEPVGSSLHIDAGNRSRV